MKVTTVILAAGQGTRMRSEKPKVLHSLLGAPMLSYAIQTAVQVTGTEPILVLGHGVEQIRKEMGEETQIVLQEPQLGTGHAVQQAEKLLRGKTDLVLVTYGDMPLIKAETLSGLVEAQKSHSGPLTILTLIAEDPRGFGRVLRDDDGSVQAIVEEAQATAQQLTINELNAGVYCFNADWLWDALERVPISQKGEYYLTDVVEIAVSDGYPVQAFSFNDSGEAIGINTRVHLAEAETLLSKRINHELMSSGVTIMDPASTYIEPHVQVGQDTIIWPNTYLQGKTIVGSDCSLGPNTIIRDTLIGDRCKVLASVLEQAVLENEVDVGPFGHLRKGAHLSDGAHMGNFGEVKNSHLGPGVKMGHFSYIGDATIGADVNIGAGTITCNYDGVKKNPTEIEADVFIGSDTMLVAPLKLGKGSLTGAGSVVTKDVPAYTLAVGAPARAIRKLRKSD